MDFCGCAIELAGADGATFEGVTAGPVLLTKLGTFIVGSGAGAGRSVEGGGDCGIDACLVCGGVDESLVMKLGTFIAGIGAPKGGREIDGEEIEFCGGAVGAVDEVGRGTVG